MFVLRLFAPTHPLTSLAAGLWKPTPTDPTVAFKLYTIIFRSKNLPFRSQFFDRRREVYRAFCAFMHVCKVYVCNAGPQRAPRLAGAHACRNPIFFESCPSKCVCVGMGGGATLRSERPRTKHTSAPNEQDTKSRLTFDLCAPCTRAPAFVCACISARAHMHLCVFALAFFSQRTDTQISKWKETTKENQT